MFRRKDELGNPFADRWARRLLYVLIISQAVPFFGLATGFDWPGFRRFNFYKLVVVVLALGAISASAGRVRTALRSRTRLLALCAVFSIWLGLLVGSVAFQPGLRSNLEIFLLYWTPSLLVFAYLLLVYPAIRRRALVLSLAGFYVLALALGYFEWLTWKTPALDAFFLLFREVPHYVLDDFLEVSGTLGRQGLAEAILIGWPIVLGLALEAFKGRRWVVCALAFVPFPMGLLLLQRTFLRHPLLAIPLESLVFIAFIFPRQRKRKILAAGVGVVLLSLLIGWGFIIASGQGRLLLARYIGISEPGKGLQDLIGRGQPDVFGANLDFEQGDPSLGSESSGWVKRGTGTVSYETASPIKGSRSANLSSTAGRRLGLRNRRQFTVHPGQMHYLIATARVSTSGVHGSVQVSYFDENGNYIARSGQALYWNETSNTRKYRIVTAPERAVWAKVLFFFIPYSTADGSVVVDDIRIIPTDIIQDVAAQSSKNIVVRAVAYKVSWEIIRNWPWTGIGMGQVGYAQYWDKFGPSWWSEFGIAPPTHAHNLYLQMFVSGGLLAGVGFLFLVLLALRKGWQVWRRTLTGDPQLNPFEIGVLAAMVGVLVSMLFDFKYNLQWSTLILWVLLGTVILILDNPDGQESSYATTGNRPAAPAQES